MVRPEISQSVLERDVVTAAPAFEKARDYALALEGLGRSRGLKKDQARRWIAQRARTGFGTIDNIIRERVKTVDEKIRDKLQALLVPELEKEIARLTNVLAAARRGGGVLAAANVRKVQACLAEARSLLSDRTRPGA
jgi:hypothetical protein